MENYRNLICRWHANVWSRPVTIWYIHLSHHGYSKVMVMLMNDQLISLLFHVNQSSHSWNKAISNIDLETSRSRSWVWSTGKAIQSAQYLTALLSHQSHNNSWFQYPSDAPPFLFTLIWPTLPEFCPIVSDLEKNTSKIFKENSSKIFSNRISTESNQVISMTRGGYSCQAL